LREAGRSGGAGRKRRRTTRGLVAAQLAAAVVLVVSAGLLARSLVALNRVDPGFTTDARITARVDLAPGLPADPEARALVMDDLEQALVADPELRGVALASTIPFGSEDEFVATFIPGVTDDPNALPTARHHRVTPDFFAVAGIEVVRGRGFTDADRVGSPLVAVVDETFVQTLFGGEDPIGRTVRYPWRGAPDIEIVGVVSSTRHGDLSGERDATYYVPMAQMTFGVLGHAVVVAEAAGDPAAAMGALMRRVRDLDDRMAVSDLQNYDERLAASLVGTRLMATLLMLFAGTALVLGCVGVYGVAAFSVRERLREIGVRMAMGASAEGIRREVLREGLAMAVPGGVLGLVIAFFATRALDGLLFGVAPLDPLTFVTVPLVLGAAALLAVYVPARRATLVDPAIVLRGEG
ncbi:MAG: FtsX-like permease family protein, partial [Gemmatimonadetes bacterium]|nr:FtsX-like permease family protein [Gemmatimonadota bacterium]